MKFSCQEIRSLDANFHRLINHEFPVSISSRLAKLLDVFVQVVMESEKERLELVEKYKGDKPNKDGAYEVKDDKKEVFTKELEEILKKEVEVDFESISLEELGDFKISPVDLSKLKKIIK